MQETVANVRVELCSTETGKVLVIGAKEAFKGSPAVDMERGGNFVVEWDSCPVSKLSEFPIVSGWESFSVGLNGFNEQGTEGHHGKTVALDIVRGRFEVIDRLEKTLLMPVPQELYQTVFVFRS
jgi:hypothetical protein